MNLFFAIFLTLPFLSSLMLIFFTKEGDDSNNLYHFSKFFAIIFLIFSFACLSKTGFFSIFIMNLKPTNIELLFDFTKEKYLAILLSTIWLALIFYIEGVVNNGAILFSKRSFSIFLSIAIGLLNVLNFAGNPYTMFLFYGLSVVVAMALLQKYIAINHKDKVVMSFIASIFLELILVFIALCLLLKFSVLSNVDGVSSWVVNLDGLLSRIVLVLILLIATLNIVNPVILMLRSKIAYFDLNLFNGLVLLFVMPKLLFLKFCVESIFGAGLFANYISGFYFSIIQIFFLVMLPISLIVLFLIKDIKKLFLTIAFNQSLLSIISFLIIAFDYSSYGVRIIVNYVGFSVLFFMIMHNLVQFIENSGDSSVCGFFSSLKTNSILLGICFLAIAGLFPPGIFTAIELLSVAKENGFNSYILIFLVNSLGLIAIGAKIFFISIKNSDFNDNDERDQEIDFSSQLTLTPLAIAFIIILINIII